MKRSRTLYEAHPLRSTDRCHQDYTEHCYSSDIEAIAYAQLLQNDSDPTANLSSGHIQPCADANAHIQTGTTNTCVDIQRRNSQAYKAFHDGQQSLTHGSDGLPWSMANHIESPRLMDTSDQFLDALATSPCDRQFGSYSATSQRSTATPMSHPAATSGGPSELRSTPYSPYRSLFLTSDEARDHRHVSTRFGRQPYIHLHDDPTINQVESDRRHQVGRIYNAMVCGERAQDNPGSIAMKRWVSCAHYKSDLVEAFAHKVFDCLLVQVKEGFRGWHHNDYVDDDRKGEKEDREANCMARLENIIDALEREKTICEDVVNSASQIRMFVNAPIAYAARKLQNRLGNSKRGRTKESTESSLPHTKGIRSTGRQRSARSTNLSDNPTSTDIMPQFPVTSAAAMPYYRTPQQSTSSFTPTLLTAHQPSQSPPLSRSRVQNGHWKDTATVPHTVVNSMKPPSRSEMSPSISPALCGHYVNATKTARSFEGPCGSVAPGEAEFPTTTGNPVSWLTMNTLQNSASIPVDPSLITVDHSFPQQVWSDNSFSLQTTNSTNYSNQQSINNHVSLANVEQVPIQPTDDGTEQMVDFEAFWNAQSGVQPFSFDRASDHGLR